ncbi:MAG: DNA-directed DNA polymerase [uncultured bacterium (gcode 4)]|uniref:DNA-directed DNA polymerase n=1 Tax=uncultured bacterium (gcode 4) TaxID=1234023 RepID=K2FW72_9BACT|nr:MAG: DNA-directed DNA polymerase [uncultured bacterium (gcode 4)]
MQAFVFDTETTWFTVKWGSIEEQPYIVQFAGILWEISQEKWFVEIERINYLVKPRISIPFSSSQIHWIYDRDVENAPYIEEVMDNILKYLNTTDVVVGHNVEFDEEIIRGELARLWRKWDYQANSSICTMRSTTDYCKLQWRWFSFKPPKLNELYKFLFWDWFEWAHDAMVDVEATAKAFWELVKKWVIVLEESMVMRLF